MGLFDLFKKKETIIRELCVKADAFRMENRYEEVVQAYSRVVELDPQSCYHYNKCDALMKLGKNNEAIQAYNQAINLNPQSEYLCRKKGDALLTMKRYEEAIQAYNQANNIHKTGDAYAGIGSALMELGRYKEALEPYRLACVYYVSAKQESLKKNGFDHRIRDSRSEYGWRISSFHDLMRKKCDHLMKMGKYEETIKVAHDALSVGGDDYVQYYKYVSESLKKMGKHEEVEYLERIYDEARDHENDGLFNTAYASMAMRIDYIMKYRLNIQE